MGFRKSAQRCAACLLSLLSAWDFVVPNPLAALASKSPSVGPPFETCPFSLVYWPPLRNLSVLLGLLAHGSKHVRLCSPPFKETLKNLAKNLLKNLYRGRPKSPHVATRRPIMVKLLVKLTCENCLSKFSCLACC